MTIEPRLTRLPNGLTVHLKEIHTAPIISHWVWYRVGSRNEKPGSTGISHWVEHMQFKGTPRFSSSDLDRAIARTGGSWNAFTHMDWTTFYETLPADQINLALDLESDRMHSSLFDAGEVESERTVILSELEGSLNEPRYRLGEAMQKAAFDQHPYRNEIIGSREDLLNIRREDLYAHYQKHYLPSNAIIAVAGDFNEEEMLRKIETAYGSLPTHPVPEETISREPALSSERRVEVTGPDSTVYLGISYRAPAANDEDFSALAVLDSLLCGPTSLNTFGGGGTTNKTSRIYKALVEKDLAVSAHGGFSATIDPYLYEIDLTLRPERSVNEVLRAVDDLISQMQEELVKPEEVARAVKQARALFAYGSENITNQAFWLGYALIFASYPWFTGYVDRLAQVTPEDIRRIAQKYLIPAHRVVGSYLPDGAAGGVK